MSTNPTPHIYEELNLQRKITESVEDLEIREEIDALEIYEHIRRIKDPEHPSITLEQLKVISPDLITVDDKGNHIIVKFTPTVDNCSLATLIGLAIRTKLMRILPRRIKLDIYLTEGTHQTELETNKQLNDKERIAAALEKPSLLKLVNQCLL